MAKFILVHGAWHGAWCWARFIPLLNAQGHEVIAPDLPGLGEDRAPLTALSMEDWTASIVRAIESSPGPAVLVGHSRGGAIISNVAEAKPALVSRLIYLTAFLLSDGQSVLEAAQMDRGEPPAIQVNADQSSCTWQEADLVHRFYADCDTNDIIFAKARLRPEPLFGLLTPVKLTEARFGAVPKDYIECTQDNAIRLAAQRQMQQNWPVQRIRTLETSHSPFFSAPAVLADTLQALAT